MMRSGAFRGVPWPGLKVNTKVRIQLLTVGLAAKLLALLLLSPSLAAAVVLTVTDLGDTGGPGQLRTLIQAAAPGDTINIPAGTITLIPVGGYSVGLVIGKDLTISGAGAGATIIDGSGVSDGVIATLVLPTTVEISNLTIRNGVTNNIGGGINNGSNLLLTNVTLSGNTASVGGGIANNGTATLTNVTLSGNTAAGIQLGDGGGGIYNFGTATLTNVTVSGNTASSGGGGGIYNYKGSLILTNVTVSGNTALYGGGIYSKKTATLTNVTVSGNTSLHGVGGGISNDGTLTLTKVTINGNTGKGIANNGTATLTNVTISGNTGGGIESGTAILTNVTISGNTTSGFGGGIAYAFVTLTNVLLAGNTASLGSDNCYRGITTSLGHNLSSDVSCGFAGPGDLNNTDPKLGPLADNGGPTQTHTLLPGSPAIDAGTNTGCPSTDQRGVTRPQGVTCDIGAFEFVSTSSPGPTGPANARQLLNVATFVGPTVPPTPQQQQQTFRPTDPLLAGATYYDPAEACLGVPPAGVKFFVFTQEGQLVLGRNRDTGGVSSTQIGTSKYQALLAGLAPGALPAGSYSLVFWVKDCTDTAVLVSEFVALRVLSP